MSGVPIMTPEVEAELTQEYKRAPGKFMTTEVQALIQEYKANPPGTPKHKAYAENRIFLALPKHMQVIINRVDSYNSKWMAMVLQTGEKTTTFIARYRLMTDDNEGYPVDEGWEFLAEGGPSPASRVLRAITQAREAVTACRGDRQDKLNAYRKGMHEILSGEVSRQAKPGKKNTSVPSPSNGVSEAKVEEKAPPEPAQESEPKSSPRPDHDPLLDGTFEESKKFEAELVAYLEEHVSKFTKDRIGGLDTEEALMEVVRRFKINVHASFQELFRDIRRVRNRTGSRQTLELNARKVRQALEVLRIEVKKGWTKDDLKRTAPEIKRTYRKLLARFHPDSNLGVEGPQKEALRVRFQEVEEAFGFLQEHLDI